MRSRHILGTFSVLLACIVVIGGFTPRAEAGITGSGPGLEVTSADHNPQLGTLEVHYLLLSHRTLDWGGWRFEPGPGIEMHWFTTISLVEQLSGECSNDQHAEMLKRSAVGLGLESAPSTTFQRPTRKVEKLQADLQHKDITICWYLNGAGTGGLLMSSVLTTYRPKR